MAGIVAARAAPTAHEAKFSSRRQSLLRPVGGEARKLAGLVALALGLLCCAGRATTAVVAAPVASEEAEEGSQQPVTINSPGDRGADGDSSSSVSTNGSSGGVTEAASGCTILEHKTTYKQESAPTNIMGLFNTIYDRVNEDLDDVVKVEINYVGDVIHRLVGRHDVRATVTRQTESEEDLTNCMVVPVVIEDSDECTLPVDHVMHHECDPSTKCVNTIGSYECTCAGGEACVPLSGVGLCQGVATTAGCCAVDEGKEHNGCHDKTCESDCRRDFRCYTNQCQGKCVYPELCESTRGSVSCGCKEGEVGNGHVCPGEQPKLYTDGQGNTLPASMDPSKVCGCQKVSQDLCHSFPCGQHASCSVIDEKPRCVCKGGFREVEGFGCVDDSAPSLVLKGPSVLTMKQCDKYVERGVEVLDANSENDDRNVGVSYSQPPGRCTPDMGTFTVNYTLNTGWTHPAVQYIIRHVNVEDVDECSLDPASSQALCPGCRPHCHRHAQCENRVGTYACKCPACMDGDGFDPFVPRKSGRIPAGYEGGTGCKDICPPVITLVGDNPLVLTVGVNTDFNGNAMTGRNYSQDLSNLLARTSGGGLCEDDRSPRCAKVIDNNGTHQNVDITPQLSISNPTQVSKSPMRWQVTYEAMDEAGNYAEVKIRTIEIQEVTMEEYAQEKVREALKDCPCQKSCPDCPRQKNSKQLPCKPSDSSERRGGGGGGEGATVSCRDCACSERDSCVSSAECSDAIADSRRGQGVGGGLGGACPAASSCTDGAKDSERTGRWCLPIALSGAQQVAVAACICLGTAIVALALNR